MKNLYKNDVSHRLAEIKAKVDGHVVVKQREIIEHMNLIAYDLHKLDDEEIRTAINELFKANIRYLDLSEDEFISSFSNHYMQRIFELVMADFFSKKFRLLDRNPDETMEFCFVDNNNRYAVECVTRTAGQMDRFYKLLPFFQEYWQAAKIFFDGHTRWESMYNITNSEWHFNIDLRWHDLDVSEKSAVLEIFQNLGVDGERNVFEKLNDWIDVNRYACLLYKDLVPEDLWAKFDQIRFPIESMCGEVKSINEYALDSIVKLIIGKLRKSYFSGDESMIIAISLSTFAEFMYFEPMQGFINYLGLNLCWKLNAAIDNETDKDNLNARLKYLYAVLIDTNSYNWFPEIAKARYGAVFTDEIPNYFGIIYNTNIASHFTKYADQRIFNFIVPFCIELPLGDV